MNSATGSDTAASGAGPGTAVTGTAAATDGAGTTVTVDAGTNISGIATDGSAVVYINDTTAGHRRFSKITGSAGSGGATPTLTVAHAFTAGLSGKTWAVGGKRAALFSASTALLMENNSASGDAMPGWIIECADGHSETGLSTQVILRRAGDTTTGPIIIRGASGAATKPLFTWSSDVQPIRFFTDYWQLDNVELRCSAGTHTSNAMRVQAACKITNVTCSHSTNKWASAISIDTGATAPCTIRGCEFANCGSDAIVITASLGNMAAITIEGCRLYSNAGYAAKFPTGNNYYHLVMADNYIAANTSGGVTFENGGTVLARARFVNNDFYNQPSGKDGLTIVGTTTGNIGLEIVNNYFSTNGGYGCNFSSMTLAQAQAYGVIFDRNGFNANTSGTVSIAIDTNSVTSAGPDNGSYGSSGNFLKGTASTLLGAGYPTIIGASTQRSYQTIGCSQLAQTGGAGSGMLFTPNLEGV